MIMDSALDRRATDARSTDPDAPKTVDSALDRNAWVLSRATVAKEPISDIQAGRSMEEAFARAASCSAQRGRSDTLDRCQPIEDFRAKRHAQTF
ncbi:hypothetical protein BD293_2267 [Roseinatronobacter monicus]|uniref:Uncharacterized protein n=1 Tax=Roseinatronobacter monicus TaxID=393481 RepID=A0A543KEW8_9RHOB|nr:hypothetical protein BD293_2267 [Roseinatronobacter monicus]